MEREASAGVSRLSSWLANPHVWLLWVSLQLPSLRPLAKYLPPVLQPLGFAYLLGALMAYAALLHSVPLPGRLRRCLDRGWLLVGLILLALALNYVLYPIADALKFQMRGSDQDDALLQLARRLLQGLSPYAQPTYFGNPISTGPGLVLLLWPLLTPATYFLITPLCLGGVALVLARVRRSWLPANLLVLLCMSSPAFWETMVVGSDVFVMGGICFGVLTAVYYKLAWRPGALLLCALILGAAATSRVIFIYLIPLISLFQWKRGPGLALALGGLALAVALGLHGVFYLWDPAHYTPLHLLGKGNQLLPPVLKAAVLMGGVGVAVWAWLRLSDTYPSWLFFLWLGLVIPLAGVSFGDLWVWRHVNLAAWEGANYLLVPLPVLVAYVVMQVPEP